MPGEQESAALVGLVLLDGSVPTSCPHKADPRFDWQPSADAGTEFRYVRGVPGDAVDFVPSEPMTLIRRVMREAATTQGADFDVYWTADAAGSYDATEENLTLHVAHALRTRGFSSFAEVLHPTPRAHIDLLTIEPARSYFVAFEFKRHVSAGLRDSQDDVERLARFDLNRNLSPDTTAESQRNTLITCRRGYAVVAGLTRVTKERLGDPLAHDASPNERIADLGGEVAVPCELPRSQQPPTGRYFLQYAFFPIQTEVAVTDDEGRKIR